MLKKIFRFQILVTALYIFCTSLYTQEILTDKVYLYSYFNVLFKTPFPLDENVIINSLEPNNNRVLRTEKLDFFKYRNGSKELRAFILGFYVVSPGLHTLPELQFQSTLSGRIWLSPALPFAAFQVDEGRLPLPVSAQVNRIPQRVYLGQNIVLNVWAENVTAIDRSSLLQNPEFSGFLVQKSPITPEVKRLKILEQEAYRVSLATWLLNPIELGPLKIPAIQTSIMGLERQTGPLQIEVLPLPSNPYTSKNSSDNIAIGQFHVSLEPFEPSELPSSPEKDSPFSQDRLIKDRLIHVLLRITGHGNIHLVDFPEISSPSELVLLQSEERESLELDFDNAELFGWKEKVHIYKAKIPGKYQLKSQNFSYFDPKNQLWTQESGQDITVQVTDLEIQDYYTDLEQLSFSTPIVFWWNALYWLQSYAFYICLLFFVSVTFYFLHQLLPQKVPSSTQKASSSMNMQNSKTNSFPSYIGMAVFVALFLLYAFFGKKEMLEQANSVGDLANTSLSFYKNGKPLKALEIAYLNYTKLPLQTTSKLLLGSIRLKFGLSPILPQSFFWLLQLKHWWHYSSIVLFSACSAYFIYKNHSGKKHFKREQHAYIQRRMLISFRNYFLITIVFLLSLSIPLELPLGMNTTPELQLKAIPRGDESNWNNRLERGELIKIKGLAEGQIKESFYLVIGEKQDQGWIEAQHLFIFP